MPRLDERLKCVAKQIRCEAHADIGSDHGHLLKALLTSGRIKFGIAIENKSQPYANSAQTLGELNAEVRFGDGLQPLQANEANSLSICGMGGELIAGILSELPERVPVRVIVQPNKRADLIREWGFKSGYWLRDEFVVGEQPFDVLVLERPSAREQSERNRKRSERTELDSEPVCDEPVCDEPAYGDPAYEGLDREAAILFGPFHVRTRSDPFIVRLRDEHRYLNGLPFLNDHCQRRLDAITTLLGR